MSEEAAPYGAEKGIAMTTEERLARLEEELRNLRAGDAARGLIVRARKLIIEDAEGKIRAQLSVDRDGASLILYDASGDATWVAPRGAWDGRPV